MPLLPRLAAALLLAISPTLLTGQPAPRVSTAPVPPELLEQTWSAQWIAPADAPARAYGVYHFRKHIDLPAAPERFVVHISADNRYRIFVNGTPVHIGPARGELRHWRFDSLDLAPFLQAGPNVLAAQVWNFGEHAPIAQQSGRTAFILQGDGETEAIANTDASWTTFTNPAYSPLGDMGAHLWTYIVVGPGDEVDASRYPWGWADPTFDDSAWTPAQTLHHGKPRGISTHGVWLLVPRQIPLMESRPLRLQTVRRTTGVDTSDAFLRGDAPLTVPPHTTATVLLDQGEHTTGYPQLNVSGGADSQVRLTYAESLYEGEDHPSSTVKGDRNAIEGKHLRGFFDIYHPDGAADRTFRPLRWRTWRYLQLDIETGDDALTLNDLTAEFTAYPLREHAAFLSPDDELAQIWDIAWRTMRTGTHEIFTDSAYYEQLSYVGDTRIEALVSLWIDGDDRLMRKAIEAFDNSRDPNGLTASRWPDSGIQIIPPYSLVWVSMVHDYWMLRQDDAFVRARLGGVREVLRYFAEHSDPATGSYTGRQWWNYIDWIPAWGRDAVTGLGGVPPRDGRGTSAIIDLQHVYTLQQAAELFAAFGFEHDAASCRERAAALRAWVETTCWNEARGLIADTPEHQTFSQHANSYYILTGDASDPRLKAVAERMLAEDDLAQATFYFSFYSHAALARVGLGDRYLDQLEPWHDVLAQGLTTVPERPGPDSRSDSHAWGAHPMLGLLNTVLGITPAEPGFASVRIAPHLGALPHAAGKVPHPRGDIEVAYERVGAHGLRARIILPAGLHGRFEWRGQTVDLRPGEQQINL
ncbi:alpha-L-rhamnosidase C-terminal domain-containing protein [Actomonas aquatica]|uniref:Alpha-L-rhamnosidase C-terminal domain-containing protein n=1 Tax=Actomonas aquatica TaxID=2866162 RepID=A0ABZ1C705_9BACT|nr:alpha-L-rhamnosidase C-terminal domain-containing protein [Opitutus sp. WL0086]WRQ87182.1 alpha-L-rhamnosidase C-terminal domain-containing protein [Opitutus sp. WL0086]